MGAAAIVFANRIAQSLFSFVDRGARTRRRSRTDCVIALCECAIEVPAAAVRASIGGFALLLNVQTDFRVVALP